ncbi:MAG: family 20 glycosylhydrolase [Kiritimatiellae bacterium]|nr:family 20 glycosylhydrolase [Kiritimatiellia bacterium]
MLKTRRAQPPPPFGDLLPAVQSVELAPGLFDFTAGGCYWCADAERAAITISRLFLEVEKHGLWERAAAPALRGDASIVFELRAGAFKPQGYRLQLSSEAAVISASDEAGLYYGALTLLQLVSLTGGEIPGCVIDDAPDFAVRGVMLDISRDKVPAMRTLLELIDKLSAVKINHLQLYMEHTFAYQGHERVWRKASPLDAAMIRQLDQYCANRFIELVPNQNSFGHMERWLVHREYNHMAALPEGGAPLPWGGVQRLPTALNPMDEQCLVFLDGLYRQLLPNFSAKLFNVGCDEVFGLHLGRCAAEVKEHGAGRVYLEFLKKIFKLVRKHGCQPAFWGDIIVKYPELVAELPREAVALEWGYEADHPFAERCQLFQNSGLTFYLCPGTSSWNSIAGRHENMRRNILSAAEHGLRYGAEGLVVTDWGDAGHWQPLSTAYAGFAYAAGLAWSLPANRDMDVAAQVSRYFVGDQGGALGEILAELGGLYQMAGALTANSSVLFHLLFKESDYRIPDGVSARSLDAVMQELERLSTRVEALPAAGGAERIIVVLEIQQIIRLLQTACFRGQAMLNGRLDEKAVKSELGEMITTCAEAQEMVWLLRNRRGGLSDSLARIFT